MQTWCLVTFIPLHTFHVQTSHALDKTHFHLLNFFNCSMVWSEPSSIFHIIFSSPLSHCIPSRLQHLIHWTGLTCTYSLTLFIVNNGYPCSNFEYTELCVSNKVTIFFETWISEHGCFKHNLQLPLLSVEFKVVITNFLPEISAYQFLSDRWLGEAGVWSPSAGAKFTHLYENTRCGISCDV